MMPAKRLGARGPVVSTLTLGTSALRHNRDAAELVAEAVDRGIRAIELDAGDGHAVAAVAEGAGGRDIAVLARVPSRVRFDLPSPHVTADEAYPGRHLREEVDRLLRSLRIPRLDLLQLQDWCPEWLEEGDWREAVHALRAEGKIGALGVSLFDHDIEAGMSVVAEGTVDAVDVMFNVFDPFAAADLLPLCIERGVGVIARAPLYHGMLVDAADRPKTFTVEDWRRAFLFDEHHNEASRRADQIAAELPPGERLSDVAIRYSLSHPAVTTVAVGARTREQLLRNTAAAARGDLPAEWIAALSRHRWLC